MTNLIISQRWRWRPVESHIEGLMDASKAPRMNLKMAIPVKEVKADMIQRLAPHPKNLKSAKGFINKG
jgi:hypothetical protein